MKKDKCQFNSQDNQKNDITRKEALKKAGKYAALTAATMLIVLSPKESQAESPPTPGWGN
jgi:hypothetical protein